MFMNRVTVVKDTNYTVITNAILRDTRLSLKAKGLLVTILGLPPTWDFTIKGICKVLKEGRDAITSAIDELIECGYCSRTNERGDSGQFLGYDYTFYESPIAEKPDTDLPDTGFPDSVNPTQLSIDSIKYIENKKNKEKKNSETDGNRPIAAMTLKPRSDFQCLMDYHANRIGTILDGGAQGKAIKKLLKYFTVDECIACYEYQLTSWREAVSWLTVASGSGIAQWKANGSPARFTEKTNGKLGNAEILEQYGRYFSDASDNGYHQLGTSDTGMGDAST